jgi:hypothetical protein
MEIWFKHSNPKGFQIEKIVLHWSLLVKYRGKCVSGVELARYLLLFPFLEYDRFRRYKKISQQLKEE